MEDDKESARRSSKRFLVLSLVIAFPLLLLVFAQVFSVFVLRPLTTVLPADIANGWPVQVGLWFAAAAAAWVVCRLILRQGRTRDGAG
jgi:hypothetical protein